MTDLEVTRTYLIDCKGMQRRMEDWQNSIGWEMPFYAAPQMMICARQTACLGARFLTLFDGNRAILRGLAVKIFTLPRDGTMQWKVDSSFIERIGSFVSREFHESTVADCLAEFNSRGDE